jgi:hypothetical protein
MKSVNEFLKDESYDMHITFDRLCRVLCALRGERYETGLEYGHAVCRYPEHILNLANNIYVDVFQPAEDIDV